MQVLFLGMLNTVNAISIYSMIVVLFTLPLMTATRKSRQTGYDKQQALAGENLFRPQSYGRLSIGLVTISTTLLVVIAKTIKANRQELS